MESNSNSKLYIYHLTNGFTFEQYTELKDLSEIIRYWEDGKDTLNIGRYTVKPKDLILIEQSTYK
jgi:hypothetical protein